MRPLPDVLPASLLLSLKHTASQCHHHNTHSSKPCIIIHRHRILASYTDIKTDSLYPRLSVLPILQLIKTWHHPENLQGLHLLSDLGEKQLELTRTYITKMMVGFDFSFENWLYFHCSHSHLNHRVVRNALPQITRLLGLQFTNTDMIARSFETCIQWDIHVGVQHNTSSTKKVQAINPFPKLYNIINREVYGG